MPMTNSISTKNYVTVTPHLNEKRQRFYTSNAKVGDTILFQKEPSIQNPVFLNKPALIIEETPLFFIVDIGIYLICVSKSAIYCRDEILYFPS